MAEPGSQLDSALEAAEQVREDLRRQLHDTLCQSLTGLNMMVRVLARRARLNVPVPAARLEELGRAVDEIVGEAGALLRQLQPLMPEEGGLMEGLAQLALETSSKTRCTFHCDEPVFVSDPKVAIALYRIADEAVRHAVRHARATEVTLTLSLVHGQITLEIRDNGRPSTDETSQAQDSILRQTRAAAMGVDLAIISAPGGGTNAECKIPRKPVQETTQKSTLRQRTGDSPDSAA